MNEIRTLSIASGHYSGVAVKRGSTVYALGNLGGGLMNKKG